MAKIKQKQDRMMRIYKRFFNMLKDGSKIVEIRVAFSSMKSIKVGDVIRFNNDSSCRMLVTRISHYNNFNEMMDSEDINEINPRQRADELLRELRQIFPSNKEKLGVVAFKMEKI